jgi:hypothetical protein
MKRGKEYYSRSTLELQIYEIHNEANDDHDGQRSMIHAVPYNLQVLLKNKQ